MTALGEKKLRPVLASVLLVAVFLGGRFCLRTVYEQRSGVEINDGAPMILSVAVYYTHLDVYKRQRLIRERTQRYSA